MSTHFKLKKSPQEAIFTVLRQISYTKLFKKYTSGNFSYNKISINRLLFSDNCLIVARFKDYLILDDQTEFIRRFYPTKDLTQKLNKILTFYEKYSKIFPNYLVLKENRYLYRNIRRKQKMIDAFNEIKREEKENRKKLKIDENDKNNNNELFTKKIKNEIKTFQNNVSFKNYRNSFDSDKINDDTLLINQNSIYYRQLKDGDKSNKKIDSFIENQTNGSISYLVNVLNDNKIYTKDLPNILIQNNNKNIITKNKKTKYGIEMKNKINKKIQKIKEANQNSIKIINNINNISNKDENELQSSKHIKNNSIIKKKKIIDKNSLYKGAFTSTNATNSSSFVLKKNKNPQISSSININNKDNKENKENKNIQNNKDNKYHKDNSESKNIQNNKDKKYHKDNSESKNIQNNKDKDSNKCYINNDNNNNIIIKNLYQKTSSDFSKYESKKNFSKTNNNFKKAILNDYKNIKDNEKENTQKNKDDNNKKEKYKINKEIVKKKYIRCKHISQDFDSNQIYKMTENILYKNNNNTPNENSNNIINTENIYFRPYKNYIINDNPNLITGDTKSNERNEKNFMEDKDIMNIRDLIIQEKEDKKIYYTAKKTTKNSLLKLTKTNPNSEYMIKSLKLNKSKNNYFNTIDNNYKKDIIYNNIGKNNKTLRNNSAITKQKTELQFGNKKILTKNDKTKTRQIFINNLIKSLENKKLFLKTSENFNMSKKIFEKSKDKEIKEKTIDLYNMNRNKKFYDKRYESTYIPLNYQKKMINERIILSNLSDINMNKKNIILKSSKKRNKKYKTKNHITKSNNKTNINTNWKLASSGSEKDYRSYLKKNNNTEFNYSSQKSLLSISILNRIQALKQNKTKNDFYRNLKLKNSTKSFHANNSSKSKSISEIKNSKKAKTYKTPIMNNKKTNCYKKHISKKLEKVNLEKTKDEMMNTYMSSFSIKVNKTTYNKENSKSKNLKKMWSKQITNIVNQINNNRRNELKY